MTKNNDLPVCPVCGKKSHCEAGYGGGMKRVCYGDNPYHYVETDPLPVDDVDDAWIKLCEKARE